MSTSQETVDAFTAQLDAAGDVRSRKMFGEYAVYCDDRVVALVCDGQFYLKPTEAGRALLRDVDEAPPYPGAKNYYRIAGEYWDDRDYVVTLVRATTKALPLPRLKPPRRTRTPRGDSYRR